MRPSETVGEFSSSSEADADAAVAAAAAAFASWARAADGAPRGAYLNAAAAVLEARAEEIARDMTTEMGKPLREARGEAGARGADPALRGERGVPARSASTSSRRRRARRSRRDAGPSASSR